jgi:hypothetical protein
VNASFLGASGDLGDTESSLPYGSRPVPTGGLTGGGRTFGADATRAGVPKLSSRPPNATAYRSTSSAGCTVARRMLWGAV